MGTFLINVVVFLVAMFIGSLGFSNIIGSIKYPVRNPAATIIIWVIILGGIAALAHLLPGEYLPGFYVGYVVSFLGSFTVKPD